VNRADDDHLRDITAMETWLTAELEPIVPDHVLWKISCTQGPVFRRWRVEEHLEFELSFGGTTTVSIYELLRHRPFRRREWVTELSPQAAAGCLRASIVELAQTHGFELS
jgi:hypothetical protein